MLATILFRLGRGPEAEQVVTQALACKPGIADAYDGLAHVSMLMGRYERSNALYRRVVSIDPSTPRFWYNLASSERIFGRLAEAEAACDRAIALDRTQYPSYLLRAELRVQTPEANHVAVLLKELTRPGIYDRARLFLGYAVGKELDDLGRCDEAFHWFQEAASTRRRHLSYTVGADERKLERIKQTCSAEAMHAAPHGIDSSRYVFVVGLPRSGTTLVERILLGLSGVRSNGETENFSRALLAASPSDSRDVFARAAAADPETVAAGYERLAAAGDTAAVIIEKLPLNYLYLGVIHRALPLARLVLLRRSPLDSCFAMYRTLFGDAYPFSYDFEELARYYAAYQALIDHWRASFGECIHEVCYEDLVRDPARVGAALARHCGLAWSDRALEVQANTAISLTASAAQIRRPIYGTSSGRWRRYRVHLAPLIGHLRARGVELPEDA
jgi:tetratricopeptide (TPR) repeat protein